MTITEFFWLSDNDFRMNIAEVGNDDLEYLLTFNRRARHGSKYGSIAGATLGLGAAIPTFGVSLIGVPRSLTPNNENTSLTTGHSHIDTGICNLGRRLKLKYKDRSTYAQAATGYISASLNIALLQSVAHWSIA